MKSLLDENFKNHTEFVLRDPILFGDYKNALEESEPRLYEDIQVKADRRKKIRMTRRRY